jgi:hypothetical protein
VDVDYEIIRDRGGVDFGEPGGMWSVFSYWRIQFVRLPIYDRKCKVAQIERRRRIVLLLVWRTTW